MTSLAIALVTLAAGSSVVAPSDLLVAEDVPSGFELVVEQPSDLTFEEYAELSPDAMAHVDPDGSAAQTMLAAVDVWASEADDVLLREVTRWPTETDARAFVEQAVVVGVKGGLVRTDPPVDGGVAFEGADEGLWTRTVAWQQGRYAMSVAHFAVFEGSDRIIDETATALAERVVAETGRSVAAAPDAGVETEAASDGASGDGITIGTILLWIVVIGGVTWLIMRLRRRASRVGPARGRSDRDDARTGDDPGSDDGEREIEAIPDPPEPGWRPPSRD